MKDSHTATVELPREYFPWPPMTEVLVRDDDVSMWVRAEFVAKISRFEYAYYVSGADEAAYRQCIPHAGNEHLEGTTGPEGTPKPQASASEEVKAIRVYKDGDAWCALIGPDLMEGEAGFGSTPAEAVNALGDEAIEQLFKE